MSLLRHPLDAVVVLDRPGPYLPGDTIRPIVRLAATSARTGLPSVRIQLIAREAWGQRPLGPMGPLDESAFPAAVDTFVLDERTVDLDRTAVVAGWQVAFQTPLRIPDGVDLVPRLSAEVYDGWIGSGVYVRLLAAPRRSLSPAVPEVPVPVVVPPAEAGGKVERRYEGPGLDLRLVLPRREWVEGEPLTGIVSLHSQQRSSPKVEVELVVRETGIAADHFDFETTVASWASGPLHAEPDEERAVIFEFRVPALGRPTHRSGHFAVEWSVRCRTGRSVEFAIPIDMRSGGGGRRAAGGPIMACDLPHSPFPPAPYTRRAIRRMAREGDVQGLIEVMETGEPGGAYELAAHYLLRWRDVCAWAAVLNGASPHLYGRAARALAREQSHAAHAILVEAANTPGRSAEEAERRRVAHGALAKG